MLPKYKYVNQDSYLSRSESVILTLKLIKYVKYVLSYYA